jgi:two-component system response regulator GlrR
MPLALQVKLLRVLQEREVRPVGSTQSVKVDVRVISATHRDLRAESAARRFREDLYYRLNVVSLALPPLAARREDIPLLASHFLALLAMRYGKTIAGFAPDAMERLGRGRMARQRARAAERRGEMRGAVPDPVDPCALVDRAMEGSADELASFDEARRSFERDYLTQLLRVTDGNVSQAARLAKRNRSDFYSLLNRHQLDPASFKSKIGAVGICRHRKRASRQALAHSRRISVGIRQTPPAVIANRPLLPSACSRVFFGDGTAIAINAGSVTQGNRDGPRSSASRLR